MTKYVHTCVYKINKNEKEFRLPRARFCYPRWNPPFRPRKFTIYSVHIKCVGIRNVRCCPNHCSSLNVKTTIDIRSSKDHASDVTSTSPHARPWETIHIELNWVTTRICFLHTLYDRLSYSVQSTQYLSKLQPLHMNTASTKYTSS